MTIIDNNAPNKQRESKNGFSNAFSLDIQDDFHKMLSQTKSLVTFMLCNENMEGIPHQTIADLLWLVQDRLGDMESSYKKLTGGFVQ